MSRTQLCVIGVALIALQSGCATTRGTPPDFNLERAHIDVGEPVKVQVHPGLPSKATDAATGAAVGAAGVGLYAGFVTAVSCVFAGPFAGACFAVVVPAAAASGAAIGAITGGVYVAATTDAPEEVAAKRELLKEATAGVPVGERLVAYLQKQARESANVELQMLDSNSPESRGTWGISLGSIYIQLALAKPGEPYALTAFAELMLRKPGSSTPTLHKRYEVRSRDTNVTTEWRLNVAAAARASVDHMMASLARKMIDDLSGKSANWSDYVTPSYSVRADNKVALKSLGITGVAVGAITGPDAFDGNCRAAGALAPPDGMSHTAYLRNALEDELKVAAVHAAASPRVILSGIVHQLEFSSMRGLTGGSWDIDVTLSSSNGNSLRIAERYEFEIGIDGLGAGAACKRTAEAYMPAVQNLIGKIVRSPEFNSLVQ